MDHNHQHMHHEMPQDMPMSTTTGSSTDDMGDMGHDHSTMTMAMWVCILFFNN